MPDARVVASRPAVEFHPLSLVFQRDPLPISRRLREESPVSYSPTNNFFAITRHEDVKKALLDTDTLRQGELASATVPEKYTDRIPQHFFAKSLRSSVVDSGSKGGGSVASLAPPCCG